jgi:cyclohexa-1,5-dienecarbonyl-CoA hydratase
VLTTESAVRVERSADGQRLQILLNRPKANIVTRAMMADLRAALAVAARHPGLKLVTIEGAGDHFSYGASVEEHAGPLVAGLLSDLRGLLVDLIECPAPTAAVVRGQCLGGGFELALACDFIFAQHGARLGVPELTLGVFPPAAAALLPARVGASRAARAVLRAEALPAAWWAEAGLVEEVSPDVEESVRQFMAAYLSPRSAAALRLGVAATRGPMRTALTSELPALERLYLDDLLRTEDATEGIAAFMEKRPPRWRHQ